VNEQSFNVVRSGLSKRAALALAIPARYQQLSLQNFEGRPIEVEAARDAIIRSAGVFITGPCGVGKSHLAAGLLLSWYADALAEADAKLPLVPRPQGQFACAADLVTELADLGKRGEGKFLRKYDAFECVVIDDFGAEISTDRSRKIFGALIDRRYRRIRRTIITSNLNLQQISELYDDRTASRIAGMCEQISLDGADRRVHPMAFPPAAQRVTQ